MTVATLFLVFNSCKKELFDREKIDPKQKAEILAYKNDPKVEVINLEQFKKKANLNALGTLKQQFVSVSPSKGVMSINTAETYLGFKIITDSIKVIKDEGHTMYVFPVVLSSKRAASFQNLTIDESADGTVAFVNTYTPTKKWIADWKDGHPGKFEGDIKVNYLKLNNGNTTSGASTSSKNNNQPTLAVAQLCTNTTYYFEIPYTCASGQHYPWNEGCTLFGDEAAGYALYEYIQTDCVDVPEPGTGGTTPNPPPDYDPCPETPEEPPVQYSKKQLGNKIRAVPPTECDSVIIDCAGVPGGTAYVNPDCNTCMGGTTGITECPPDTVMTDNFVKNTKAMCALGKLMNNSFYKSTLNNFIGETKPIDLTFKLESISTPGFINYGTTIPSPLNWNSKNIDLILNADIIDSLPSIQVAYTLLHEGIHAEIYRKLLIIHGPSNLNGLNFPSMYNLYQQYKLSQGFSHEYMANYYIDIMGSALKQYDNDKFEIGYYKSLAWMGLEGTEYYNTKLTPEQRLDIGNKTTLLLKNRSKQNCND